MRLTREQLEVINLLKAKNKNIAYISAISTHEMQTYYEFLHKNSKAFEIILYTDKSLTANSTMLVISPRGKIAFFDRFFDLDCPEKKLPRSWSKERSINMCRLLELPEELLITGPNLVTLKTLNKIFNEANGPDDTFENKKTNESRQKHLHPKMR